MPSTNRDPVEDLVAAIRSGTKPTTAQVDAVCAVVNLWLRRRVLNDQDREELALDAAQRLVTAVERDRLRHDRPAGAWLRVVANNLSIDHLRKQPPVTALEFNEDVFTEASEDEWLARLFESDAAARDVWRALQEAGDAGERQTVRIIATWLGLASLLGSTNSREVGKQLGISHMTVQRAVKRFAARLPR